MDVSGTLVTFPAVGASWAASALVLWMGLAAAVRIRIKRPRPGSAVTGGRVAPRHRFVHLVVPSLSTLGMALALSTPAGARDRRPVPPRRLAQWLVAPPWSSTDGFPPPRPSVGTRLGEVLGGEPADTTKMAVTSRGTVSRNLTRSAGVPPPLRGTAPDEVASDGRRHSSLETDALETPTDRSLGFDAPCDPEARRKELLECMKRHPAGKGLQPGQHSPTDGPGRRKHVVVAGETLWSIAATVLRTDEPARVARYWPRIHRANRSTIGPDPDRILPGQVLELPSETSR